MTIPAITDLSFYSVLAAKPEPTLVVVTAPHCGACRVLKQALLQLQLTAVIQLFELDAVDNPSIVQELEIFHLPALFLYVAGEFHAEIKTTPSITALQTAIEYALSQPAQEAP